MEMFTLFTFKQALLYRFNMCPGQNETRTHNCGLHYSLAITRNTLFHHGKLLFDASNLLPSHTARARSRCHPLGGTCAHTHDFAFEMHLSESATERFTQYATFLCKNPQYLHKYFIMRSPQGGCGDKQPGIRL